MDMFSKLTDDSLIKILSYLPTKDAVAMSVLSKRWQSLWTLVPRLYFEDVMKDNVVHCFPTHVVYGTLLLNKSPVLESFKVYKSFACSASEIYLWVRIAVDRFVRHLGISFEYDRCLIRFPSSLFRCPTLETLQLQNVTFLDVPSRCSLPSLRMLDLRYVKYADEGSFTRLISSSPVLKKLVVGSFSDDNVTTFTINVPSLRSLTVSNTLQDSETNHHRFVIHSHSMKILVIDDECGEVIVIGKMPNLVEARLYMTETKGNALASVTHVKELSLTANKFKYTIGSIFSQLVRLVFLECDANLFNLLMHMLHHSPLLQFLQLLWMQEPNKFSWIQPSCVGLLHLKTFEWRGYAGKEQEKEVASYILKNAKQLVTATIEIDSDLIKDDPVESARKLKVLEELEFATRGSRACELTMYKSKNLL